MAGTIVIHVSSDCVDEAAKFRARAGQCRDLARDAKDPQSRRTLGEMATELDEEAEKIEAEAAAGKPAD